ncbi:MAG: hypothetical protein DI535_09415 [Citrobacter freundii]|nr:MAG: hypothetical protein DI535_09415 [Citrobacter freundii]
MKSYTIFFVVLLTLPFVGSAQIQRKGTYGNAAAGYGSYILDLYEYAGGRNIYIDQKFSGPVVSLGIEKKSAWTKNQFVFDVGGDLTGGFAIKTNLKATGNIVGTTSGGYLIGLKGSFKAGYVFSDKEGTAIPLIGLGPYFNYINSGGDNAMGNYIYGLQASVGVELPLKKLLLTPEIHVGLASWGWSDEMEQNGQPGMFEIKIKLAKKF